jgi:hypothetical protein
MTHECINTASVMLVLGESMLCWLAGTHCRRLRASKDPYFGFFAQESRYALLDMDRPARMRVDTSGAENGVMTDIM